MCVIELHSTLNYIKNVECRIATLLRQIYFTVNDKTYVGLHIKGPMQQRNKRTFVCSPYLARQIVMTDKSLRSFSVFVSVAIRVLGDRMEVINYEVMNIKHYER